MAKREEISKPFEAEHSRITALYRADPKNYPGNFHQDHANNWLAMETALEEAGYMPQPAPTDLIEARLDDIEQRLGNLESKTL